MTATEKRPPVLGERVAEPAKAPAKRDRDPWVDVPRDHDPDPPGDADDFGFGVGLEGYERGTGDRVVKRPGLKRPGETEAAASPFEE